LSKTVQDYLDLVPPLHANKPKFMAEMALNMQPYVDAQTFLEQLPIAFDIDYAIGVQLDVCGQWVGRTRTVPIPMQDPFFSWDDPLRGWDRGIWFDPDLNLGVTYTNLADEDYRRLLKCIAVANEWDGTAVVATQALQQFFTPVLYPDTLSFALDQSWGVKSGSTINMGLVLCISGVIPSVTDLLIMSQGLLGLKPAGISIEYAVTSVNGSPLFGFDVDNEYIGGWDEGAWGVSPEFIAHADPALLEHV
jgi:hypothetical protein